MECAACAVQSLYGCCIKRLAVLVEIGAKQSERRNLAEGVDKRRLEARQHIQVAAFGVHKREQARAIYALAARQNSVEILEAVEHEVQSL